MSPTTRHRSLQVLAVLAPDHRLTVRGVTITGGQGGPQSGGGLFLSQGALRLESCVVTAKAAPNGQGGGVYDVASNTTEGVQIVDSWITGNTSDTASAISSTSLLLVDRSTISDNSGGASIWLYGMFSTLRNTTVSGNLHLASDGGVGVAAYGVAMDGCTLAGNSGSQLFGIGYSPTLRNTLVVGPCSSTPPTSLGGNLESPGNTCNLGGSDLVNVPDPLLSTLDWFGGPTPTHRPLPGSPAVDQSIAVAGCLDGDQRSLARPQDGDGNGSAVCDVGAVELAGEGEIFVETFACGYSTP